MEKSRAWSFFAVSLIYIFATAAGVLAYRALPFGFWLSLLVADIAATVVTFIFSVILGNASAYDPYWSVQPPVILFDLALGTLGILLIAVSLFAVIMQTISYIHMHKYRKNRDGGR